MILSHLTAIRRKGPSLPLKLALKQGLLKIGQNILDYGCGRSEDVTFLNSNNFQAFGYDPYFQPLEPTGKFDIVFCSYVLNVIANVKERIETLFRIREKLCEDGLLITTVRSKQEVESHRKSNWKSFNDGYSTPKNTFQHGFILEEIQSLHRDSGFVFRKVLLNNDAVGIVVEKK